MPAFDTLKIMKTAAVLFSLLIPVIFAASVLAQDASTSGRPARPPFLIKQRVEAKRENVADKLVAMRENIASREAALKAKLRTFRDQRKAQVAERINETLNKINQNQTDQMLKFLDKVTSILDKLQSRVDQNSPDVKDPAAAKAAIVDARTKVASAEAAVKEQAQNDYTISVSSESTVRQDAKSAREKLHTDLMAVRKLVIDAKQAAANAIRVAKSGKIESPSTSPGLKEATESGQ